MNFGFRLPGPFRVGVSSKGRVNVGMTMGPFSVSTSGAARSQQKDPRPVRLYGTVEQHVTQAQAEGWTVTGQDANTALLQRGHDALRIQQVRGGVEVSPIHGRLGVIVAVLGGLAPVVLCLYACESLRH